MPRRNNRRRYRFSRDERIRRMERRIEELEAAVFPAECECCKADEYRGVVVLHGDTVEASDTPVKWE